MIFQNPYASLNPRWRVYKIVSEPIKAFGLLKSHKEISERTAELLLQVGLSPETAKKYPHEFSGGPEAAHLNRQGPGQPAGIHHLR